VFHRADIADFMREAAANNMCAIMHPSGEVEVFPAIHSRRRSGSVDTAAMSKADEALAGWSAKRVGSNDRRP